MPQANRRSLTLHHVWFPFRRFRGLRSRTVIPVYDDSLLRDEVASWHSWSSEFSTALTAQPYCMGSANFFMVVQYTRTKILYTLFVQRLLALGSTDPPAGGVPSSGTQTQWRSWPPVLQDELFVGDALAPPHCAILSVVRVSSPDSSQSATAAIMARSRPVLSCL